MLSVNEMDFSLFDLIFPSHQVLEAQRRHQKEKSGIIPTSPTPYTYNKVSWETSLKIFPTPLVLLLEQIIKCILSANLIVDPLIKGKYKNALKEH